MNKPKKKTLFSILTVIILAIAGILYGLADRYLIEHVEVSNVSAPAVVQTLATQVPAAQAKISQASLNSQAATSPATATPAAAASTVTSDDWNYKSATTSISVKKVTTGSGSSQVTYYVADVVISDASQLLNAFAKNSFGRNIIEYTSQIAKNNNAIFAINGDYYGFRSDGIIIRNGVIYRNVPARVGLAFYKDGSMKIYDETKTNAQALLDAGVWNTLSFGPALMENGVVASSFNEVNIDTNIGNRSIQGDNPRTGIGIISNNHFVFVVVDGRSTGYSQGVSLEEFAQIFKNLGAVNAYNIDGGGSSTLYFMGRVVNNPLGKNQERGTSDILYIGG